MADTAVRLYGPAQPGTSATTVYTVPAATTTTVRNIHVDNTTGTAAVFNLSIGVDAAATELYTAFSVPANGTFDWSGFLVMAATEVIQAKQTTSGALTMTISGVQTA